MYRSIDLFAGIGGTRLGFDQAFGDDIETVFVSEWDKYAAKTYAANFGDDVPVQGDITKIDEKDVPAHDIILAGFPCQPFSQAGAKRGFSDFYKGRTRGTLFFDILRIATYHKPKVIFCENVKGLARHDRGKTFKVIKGALEETGYTVFWTVLNSKDFGVPQNRERTYIIAFRNDIAPKGFEFPVPPCPATKLDDILEKDADKKYFITEQYLQGLIRHRERHEKAGHGFGYIVRERDGIAGTLTCSGSGRENNLVQDKRNDIDFTGYKGDGKQVNHLYYRMMTPREFARLQGFPDSFKIPVSDTQAYRQFGNAVTVPVIRALGSKVHEVLKAADAQGRASE